MKDVNNGYTKIAGFFLTLFSLVLFASVVQARDVTFTWTANTDTVDGYRLYYKTGTIGGAPYDGTGATEGNSPVDTGNVTTFTLRGLSDSATYHFVLTAVTGTLESDYSTELTLAPLPTQTPPGISATFSWLPNQETTLAGYKIYYGTVSGTYDNTIDVGNPAPVDGRIHGQVNGLVEGTTYYFAVTAYDTNGLESDYSTEVSWTATSPSGSGNPPTATGSSLTTPEDQAVSGSVTAAGDSGLPITYLVQQDVANGILFMETGTGHFTYTPRQNYAGTDSFTFLARNDNGDSNLATVAITITAVNDPPTAQNAALTVSEDTPANGQLQAQDTDNDSLSYAIVTPPAKGTLTTLNTATGAFTYTPDANATGTDSFTFRASDGQATSNTATVAITISATNDPPVAQNAAITVSEDTPANGQLQAQDPDNDSLSYAIVTPPAKGTLTTLNTATGAFTYTPDANATGTDSFTFRASDGQATSNTATVAITISGANDPPVAQNAAITVSEDTATNGQLQAQDPEGSSLTYTVAAGPTRGSLTIQNSGAFTYTPDADVSGSDSFTFQVSDGQATSNIATVSITISPVNDVPVAANGSLTAPYGQTTAGILHATDKENDGLTFSIASDPQQVVTLTNPTTGAYIITPNTGMASPYSFTFTANDGTAVSNTATVTVTLVETSTVTLIFGDTPDSTHPGTLGDTFTNLNNDINAAAPELLTYSWSSTTPDKPANTIIIKTDLSALRHNIKITEAKLYLYQTGANGDAVYSNSIHKIIGKDPIIDQVTGYNAFNGTPWTPVPAGTTNNDIPLGLADIGPAQDTIALDSQSGYRTWVITDMVQEWINDPTTNLGLLIAGTPTSTETGRTFAASENPNSSIRPKLVISYVKKPPRPSIIFARPVK